jgi:hypothetical protein
LAFHWALEAAKRGDAESAYHVGNSYALGMGIEQNLDEAIKWLSQLAYPKATKANRQDEMLDAQIMMSAVHYWPGSRRDLAKAYGWILLAICYGQPWDVEETPFNIQILEGRRQMAGMLEGVKTKIEAEMTPAEREAGQKMALELFAPFEGASD